MKGYRWDSPWLALVLLLLVLACAHGQSPLPASEAPPRPMMLLPRSSIAAVIAHRGDMELTDEQVERLRTRDDELDKAQATLRAAFERRKEESQAQGGRQPVAGMGGPGGRHRNQPRSDAAASPKPSLKSIEEQLDDNDTHAYLSAEAAVLTEKQREPARDFAEKYREDLYDQREQAERQTKDQ